MKRIFKTRGKNFVSVVIALALLLCTCCFVSSAAATSIRINVSQVTIQSGGQYQLSAIIMPSNSSKTLKWSSSNSNVASVNNNGLVTGRNSGTATITCTTTDGSNLSASCTVTVAQLISSISMQGNLEIYTGDSQRLSVTITPSNATTKGLRWSSSNSNVASVNDGVVTGIAPGTATVTCVTTDGSKKSASCTVVVKQGVTGITLNKTNITLGVGNSAQLTASVHPSNASNKSVSWSSSNNGVASVDNSGRVTGNGVGTATITCRNGDITAYCNVTVANVSNGNTYVPSGAHGNGNSGSAGPGNTNNSNNGNTVTVSNDSNNSGNDVNNVPENEGDVIELPSDDFSQAVEDLFSKNNDDSSKKYEITDVMKLQVRQSKKENPITISWTVVKGFTGYEVYAAKKDGKKETSDEDYVLLGETTGSYYEIVNFKHKKTYQIKIRTYMINEETGEKNYSDFTDIVTIKTKSMKFSQWIKSLFVKMY